MKTNIYIIFAYALAIAFSNGVEISHWGTHFVMSFLVNFESDQGLKVAIITTREATDVRVSVHGYTKTFSLPANHSHREEIDKNTTAYPYGMVLRKKAILIESSAEISVYGMNINQYTTEGFLTLPVPSLGTEYIVVNYENKRGNDFEGGQIAIISIEDGTLVTLEISKTACYTEFNDTNVEYTFLMDTYDVVNFYCKESTTGALITSNKPVALLSGNKCSFIQSSSCDHIVEMLPPTSEFGKHHVLALPGGYRFPNELKVLALEDFTDVTVNGSAVFTLNIREYKTLDWITAEDEMCIDSNKPVLAVLFMSSGKAQFQGDPLMMLIPPVNKYTNDYVLDADVSSFYIETVLIMSSATRDSLISHVPNFKNTCNNQYVYTTGVLNETTKFSSAEPLLVIVFGSKTFEGFGYPGGMQLTDYSGNEECATRPCQNYGWCLEVGMSYRCRCLPEYLGVNCEIEINLTRTGAPSTTTNDLTEASSLYQTVINTQIVTTKRMFSANTDVPDLISTQTILNHTDKSTVALITNIPSTFRPLGYTKPMYRPNRLCYCPCSVRIKTFSDLIEQTVNQQNKDKLEKRKLSQAVRSKQSAENMQSSEIHLGYSSSLLLMTAILCVILFDISRVIQWCLKTFKGNKYPVHPFQQELLKTRI